MITEQKQQYASLVENNSETRQIKHDQKNFILGALAELKQHHYEELELQLNKQLESLNSFSFPSTELPIVHAIIDFKSKSAKESSAKIECSTRILAKSKEAGDHCVQCSKIVYRLCKEIVYSFMV